MGRKKKTREGRPRSVLLRADQIRELEDLTDGLGLDFSDGVRALLDWALPAREANRRAQSRAALEMLWRELVWHRVLVAAVLDGWKTDQLVLPADAKVTLPE